ncbi:MAG: Hsp20/alpha crystallin family protein [Candidatus Helarchaeota archaeon]
MSIERKRDKKNIFDVIDEMFDSLQRAISKEFESFMDFGHINRPLWSVDEECCSLEPLVDIKATKDEVIIVVDLPKVKNKNDIDLNVSKNTIELKAELENKICYEKWGGFQKTIEFCQFRKTINLPWKIDPDKIQAKFKNGILEIRAKRINEFKSIKISDE